MAVSLADLTTVGRVSFTGFPVTALDFYDDLEMDNTKSFWEAHRAVYKEAVEAPMKALTAALEPEFGAAKVFRPYRDVRFAKDKTPYKTHQGAFVAVAPHTGWYVQVSAAGIRTSAGFYAAEGAQLAAFRTAAAEERRGTELEGPARRARGGGLRDQRRAAQNRPPRLRPRAPADRAAAAQAALRRADDRLRAGGAHPRAAGPGPRRLARHPAAGGVALPDLSTRAARRRPHRGRSRRVHPGAGRTPVGAASVAAMAKHSAYLHIGPGVPGAPALHEVLRDDVHLAACGIAVPAVDQADMDRADIEIRRRHKAHGLRRKDVEGAWAHVCRAAFQARADVLISQPGFVGADFQQVALALDGLVGLQVHLVVTPASDPGPGGLAEPSARGRGSSASPSGSTCCRSVTSRSRTSARGSPAWS